MELLHGTGLTARGRIVELDFVRGLAIIVVMGYHFHTVKTGLPAVSLIEYPLKSFGEEGVNLFFTLSGFLVGGLLLKQYASTGHIDARRFIVRRMFKIWPAYYVLILFHALIGRHPLDTFLWQNLTNLQNYYGSSIAQTWSLAIEEHFYLVLPAILLLVARWRVRANVLIAVLIALSAVVLIARSIAVQEGDLVGAFSYTQYRIDSLLLGVLLAALYWMKPDTYRQIAARTGTLVLSVLALCLWVVFAARHVALNESIGFTVQAIGFCALIVLVLEHSRRLRGWLLYRAIAWVGLYSYGIYLWHSLALEPGNLLIRRAAALALPPLLVWALALIVQFAIAIGLGYLMTRAIEYPFLRLRDVWFPDRQVAAPATGSVATAEGQLS